MRDYILKAFSSSNTLTLEQIVWNIAAACVLGLVIFLSYWLSHAGTFYSKKFNVSLAMLTVLTATVVAVIGNNVALSLGMVGALSIVRYRTAIKDSRDTAYIFWAIIGGICCGAGDYAVGAIGSATVFVLLLALGWIRNDDRMLLIVRGAREMEVVIESTVFVHFDKHIRLRVKNATDTSIEFIYEVSRRRYEKAQKDGKSISQRIFDLGNIEAVNVVSQNDELV